MDEKVAELKVTKSPEETRAEEERAKKEREARFYKDPDSFVELKDLIMASVMTKEGPAILINKAPRQIYHQILGELHYGVSKELMRRDMEEAKRQGIIVPGVNRNKLRGFLRRK